MSTFRRGWHRGDRVLIRADEHYGRNATVIGFRTRHGENLVKVLIDGPSLRTPRIPEGGMEATFKVRDLRWISPGKESE